VGPGAARRATPSAVPSSLRAPRLRRWSVNRIVRCRLGYADVRTTRSRLTAEVHAHPPVRHSVVIHRRTGTWSGGR
jgi:hypothetical protein